MIRLIGYENVFYVSPSTSDDINTADGHKLGRKFT